MINKDAVEIREGIDKVKKLSEFGKSISGKKVFTKDSKPIETIKDANEKPHEDTREPEQQEEVSNVVGSTENGLPSEYDSWLDYWEKKMRTTVPNYFTCPSCNKTKKKNELNDKGEMIDGAVGGHVKNKKNEQFICPICKKCNDGKKKTSSFYVSKKQLQPLPVQEK